MANYDNLNTGALMVEYRPKIFQVFAGMDEEYVKLVRKYHDVVTSGEFNRATEARKKDETKAAVMALKKKYVDAAKAIIEEIKNKHRLPAPTVPTEGAAERLLNVTLWREQLSTATLDELRALHGDNRLNSDFMTLFNAELRIRRANDPNDLQLQAFEVELSKEPAESLFAELDKIVIVLNFHANNPHHYPQGLLPEAGQAGEAGLGGKNVKLRQIDSDLAEHPIEGGPGIPYRTVFRLEVTK